MSLNPYQPQPVGESRDDDMPIETLIVDWRRRRTRWNRRRYLTSGAMVLIAIAVGFVSQLYELASAQAGTIIGWTLLCLVGSAALIFVFGPIAWFWSGHHRR